MIQRKNFAGVPVAQIPVDLEYRNCNFSREAPATPAPNPTSVRLFPGDDTPRTFIDCNMVNCEPPPGSTLIRCNTSIKESGVVTQTDTVTVDGFLVSTSDRTSTFTYGRWNPNTQSYQYLGTPLEEPDPR